MKRHRYPVLLGLVLGVSAAAAGCRGPAVGPCVPVQGKVTLAGKPLVGGTVSFVALDGDANRPRPEGEVDPQGLYAVRTGGTDGAPVGKYRVIVTTSGLDKKQDAQFNPVYSHAEKSPLLVQVTENPPAGAYDLKLDPR